MKLTELINPEDLQRGLNDKLINIRYSHDNDRIYNYSDAAMYTPGAWDNPAVRQCRGLIVDHDWNIIARPWAKFFNYGQAEADVIDMDEPVEVTDKADGSLGILHLDAEGEWRVATRGSFESEQAVWATEWLRNNPVLQYYPDFTPLVEIIYPENRIVLSYDFEGLVLLGGVWNDSGEYVGPQEAADTVNWSGRITEVFEYPTLREALAAPPRKNAEGLVVRAGNRMVKSKQTDYISLHKLVTGLSQKSVWQHMVDGGTLEDLLAPLPDELHDWTRGVWSNLEERTREVMEAVETQYNETSIRLDSRDKEIFPYTVRGDWATEFKKRPDLMGLLFMRLDNKDLKPAILKTLKPVGATKAKMISEDVA